MAQTASECASYHIDVSAIDPDTTVDESNLLLRFNVDAYAAAEMLVHIVGQSVPLIASDFLF